MKHFAIFALLLLPHLGWAQQEARVNPHEPGHVLRVVPIPPAMAADSLMHYIYSFNPSSYGIEYKQRSGWLRRSDKFDTDAFFRWTKQYCIERLGEAYFYENFRVDWTSFKDNADTEVYEIRYYFFPPGFSFDHQRISFKKYSFLGIEEIQAPANLPDCREGPSRCAFPIGRAAAEKIAAETVLQGRGMQLKVIELDQDYRWQCVLYSEGHWQGENFAIDARTGEVSKAQPWQRID